MDYLHVNADYIFWKTNHVTVPREQYTVINSTASSVTFPDFSLLNTQLTCNIRTFGQIDQNVYGISIVSGRKFPEFLPGSAVTVNCNFSVVCSSPGDAGTCRASGFWTHLFLKISLEAELQFHL